MFRLLQVRLDDDVDKRLDELAKEMLRTRSDVVRFLIKKSHNDLILRKGDTHGGQGN